MLLFRVGKPLLVSVSVGGPFESLGMDFVELDLSDSGKVCFSFPRLFRPDVYALSDHQAESVVPCLVDLVWCHGVSSRIIHDRTPEFYQMYCRKQLI